MAVKRITAIGDSIVDTVSRGGVTDTTQWLYKLMQALGETNIHMEPLPECSLTPNIIDGGKWTAQPLLCDGDTEVYTTLAAGEHVIPISSTLAFALRIFTKDTGFTCKVYSSTTSAGGPWEATQLGTITKAEGHSPGWSFCNWNFKSARYIKLVITGTMTVSETQVIINSGNDRGTCLNKIVGENYIVNNVGLGSAKTGACLDRFPRDVIEMGSDYVIILCGINDIAGDTANLTSVQNNLMAMYDMAQSNGIAVIPCTLLPYSGKPALFDVIHPRILTLNNWIRETSTIRRYNASDWYWNMEDPTRPGYMIPAYDADGIHLNVAGCDAIINGTSTRPPAFDLSVFTSETHDFYADPVVEIEFDGYRIGDNAYFEFWNGIETQFKLYASGTPGVTGSSTLVATVNPTVTGGIPDRASYTRPSESGSYYRVYGTYTRVWSDEILIVGRSGGSGGTVLTPFPMILGR